MDADADASGLDERVAEAYRADAKAQIGAMASSVAESCKAAGTVCHRPARIFTVAGWTPFTYPYAPKAGVSSLALAKLGAVAGEVRATPAARLAVTEFAALFDSVGESASMLGSRCGMGISAASILKILRRAGERTRALWDGDIAQTFAERAVAALKARDEDAKAAFEIAKGLRKDDGRRHLRHPEGSRAVPLTMAASSDGSGAPCTEADTGGSKGRDGGDADTREVKVLTVTFYNRVDKKGRPIVNRDCILRFASTEHSDGFISEVNAIMAKMACVGVERVQFVSDGAAWLETLFRQVFEGFRDAGKTVVRTLDFYHAAEHLATVVRALVPEAEFKATFTGAKCLMKRQDGETAIKALEEKFGRDRMDKLDGDAKKALNYLTLRLGYMHYGEYRRDGLYIGSGTVESTCKSVVATRCKLAGMHWRLVTVAAVTIIRATLRSNLKISA